MATTPTIKAQSKQEGLSAKTLLRQKLLPANYYGNGIKNQHITMDYEEFRKLYRTAGDNTIIDLVIDDKKPVKVLVHEVQRDPVFDKYTHIDFINVKMDEEITAMVPVILEGQAPAVKELGGILIQNRDEVEVKCLPADLPHEIKGNIDILIDFHTALHIKDLDVPEKVTIVDDPELTIATVSAPKEEKEEEVTPTEGEEAAEGEGAAEKPAEGEAEKKEEGGEENKES